VPGSAVVVVAEQPAERVPFEFVDDDGRRGTGARLTVTLESPAETGEYLIRWAAASTAFEALVPLLVG
jgi:hypothetical protein